MSDERTEELTPSQAPARVPLEADDRGILPIIPRDTEEAGRYASALIRAGIIPDAYREGGKKSGAPDAALILAGILKSLEVGLAPLTGLGSIYPIGGRFTVYGDGAIALIQKHRLIAKHFEQRIGPRFDPATPLGEWPDEYGWEVRYWRVGQEEPYIGRFTVRDAKRGNMWMHQYKKPWLEYPDRMLYNRARAFALRDGFADALMGLGIREEVEDTLPPVEHDGHGESRSLSALLDEPETAQIEHQPEGETGLGATAAAAAPPPADLLNTDF